MYVVFLRMQLCVYVKSVRERKECKKMYGSEDRRESETNKENDLSKSRYLDSWH